MVICQGIERKRKKVLKMKMLGWPDLRGLGGACPVLNISSSIVT